MESAPQSGTTLEAYRPLAVAQRSEAKKARRMMHGWAAGVKTRDRVSEGCRRRAFRPLHAERLQRPCVRSPH